MSGAGTVAGLVLAHRFGRDAATDGLLAAYGVYLVFALAAQAFRLVVVPELTRAGADLGRETSRYAIAFLVIGIPATIAVVLAAHALGELVTGDLPERAADVAGRALVWFVPAAFAQLLAALFASALAARERYGLAALGYALGGVASLALFVTLMDAHGVIALAWGIALGAAIALAFPLGGAKLARPAPGIGRALARLAEGSALPLALQGLYLISLGLAAGLDVGDVTSLSYAYFFAAAVVMVSATSISIVSGASLTRSGADATAAALHVVHGAWISLVVVAAAAGVFALVGEDIAELALGDAYAGGVGVQIAHVVLLLAPWMVATVGFTLTFPLLYVLERSRTLVFVALGALAFHVPVGYTLRELWGLEGIAVSLAITTLLVVVALLAALSWRALVIALRGLAAASLVEGGIALATFGVAALVLDGAVAAAAGLVAFAVTLTALRPRPLRDAWSYLRLLA